MSTIRYLSTTQRLALFIAVLLLGFVSLFGLYTWRTSKEEEVRQLRTVAELTERATDRYFAQLQVALADLAAEILRDDGLNRLARTQQHLSAFKAQHGELLAANLLGVTGQFLATSTTTSLSGLPTVGALRDFGRVVAEARPEQPMELAPPIFGPAVKRWILPVRYAIRDPAGSVVGIIVASLPVEMLQTFWSAAPVVSKASVALVRDDGFLISRYPVPSGTSTAASYGSPRDGAVMQFLQRHDFPLQGYVEGPNTLAGQDYGSVFKRLEHHPVTLVVGMPLSEFRAAWWGRTQVPFMLATLLALLGFSAFRLLHGREQLWGLQRLEVERCLRASEAFLERVGQVARVGGWALDLRTQRLTWSRQTCLIHEVEESFSPTVETAIQFYAPEAQATMASAVETALRCGQSWDLKLPLVTATGRSIWVRALGEVEYDAGKPVRLIGAFQDVTEHRQHRLDLEQEHELREQAEMHAAALDKLLTERGEMLDVLAHEVRQPLHNASAALEGARSALTEVVPADAAPILGRAQAVLSRVLANIDNTLAVAALLASPDSLRREDTDIDTLLFLAIADMPAEQQARIRVVRQSATRTAGMDLGLMRLALRNLLSNALQYSPPGAPVTVLISDSDEPLALVIEVVDEGDGVDPGLLPRLFERGTRGTHAPDRPGHGLGLYIVKRVMDLHGGSVEASPGSVVGTRMRLVVDQLMPH